MIITRNWIKEWIDIEAISTDELCVTLNSIGLEVDSVTKYEMPEHTVVGYVVEKTPHPDAQKLNICKVDIGTNVPLQIVCGAKNVEKGQYVPVALVGAVLPSGLEIKSAELRGVESNGMICSSTELGLPKTNDGIMILGIESFAHNPGVILKAIPELNDDVIEIELTANRGDCLSIHGVARDIGAALNLKIQVMPALEDDVAQLGIGRVLNLIVESKIDSKLLYKVFYQKELNESLKISTRLALVGIEANGVLDKHLAYTTHATGVILRAYRGDIFGQSEDEKINVVIKKDDNGLDTVCSDGILSYVGISQNKESRATDNDEIVVIEASYVDPEYLAIHGAREIKDADSSLYLSLRGSEPELCFGADFLGHLFNSTSKVGILTGNQKIAEESEPKRVNVNIDDMFSIIGKEVLRNDIIEILNRLGFKTSYRPEQHLIGVEVPLFRHDISNMQDICEEIVRIVGIDNIPSKPLSFCEKSRINQAMVDFQKRKFYRYKAAANGFFESVHYIFDDRARMELYGYECINVDKDILNPITVELNTLRATLSLNLLEAVSKNIKAGKKSVSLFEVGRVFDKDRVESTKMSFVSSGFTELPNPSNHGKPKEFDLFSFAQKVVQIIGDFQIIKSEPKTKLFSPYEYGEIVIAGEVIGLIGRVNLENSFDLQRAYVCEVDFSKLPYNRKLATPYSKLPSVSRDISILIPDKMGYNVVEDCIKSCDIKELKSFYAIDTYTDDSLGDKISLTITLNFEPKEKTFSDEEISSMVDKILQKVNTELKVTIR